MIKEEGKFKWIEEGKGGHPIILLHGLMGGCDNFGEMVDFISEEYRVYGLDLKLFKGRLLKVSVKDLSNYLYKFMNQLGIKSAVLIGNSMGGHIALIFAKDHPEMVDGMILTGSSGLFENSLGSSFPRRGDKNYIRTKAEEVFYDPKVATDELVDNMANDIPNLQHQTCLIWGAEDKVTPPHVAEEFHKLLPNSELNWIPKCGHAAMWEHPKPFSEIVLRWLKDHNI